MVQMPPERNATMAMVRVEPTPVQVRTGWLDGRPRAITWRDETLPVTRVSAIRHESAAYQVTTGPRTVFEVATPRARLSLSFRHRSRRWTIEAMEEPVRRA
jgi:hypothetical protein